MFKQKKSTSLAETINLSVKYAFEKHGLVSVFIISDGQFSDITDSV